MTVLTDFVLHEVNALFIKSHDDLIASVPMDPGRGTFVLLNETETMFKRRERRSFSIDITRNPPVLSFNYSVRSKDNYHLKTTVIGSIENSDETIDEAKNWIRNANGVYANGLLNAHQLEQIITIIPSLKQDARHFDMSLTNPVVVKSIVMSLSDWVNEYENEVFFPCYSKTPDEITIDGSVYTPREILNEVANRSDTGMIILKKMMDYRNEDALMNVENYKRDFINAIPDDVDPYAVMIPSIRVGERGISYYESLSSFVNGNANHFVLQEGWEDSIKHLYGGTTSRDKRSSRTSKMLTFLKNLVGRE